MPCEVVNLGNGHVAIACGRGGRSAPKCADCYRDSVALCDFKVDGKTCDRRMCRIHRTRVGPNVDYCPLHKKDAPVQEALL